MIQNEKCFYLIFSILNTKFTEKCHPKLLLYNKIDNNYGD